MNRLRTALPDSTAAIGFGVGILPLGIWYARRLNDGSDEPLGLIALAAALALAWAGREALQASDAVRRVALILFGLYGLAVWLDLPPLLRALPALGAVTCWTGLWKLPGPTILLGLSLPILASLQFYLGYPMRVMAAGLATGVLNLFTIPVERIGTQLLFHESVLGVDAPCSGIRMLWMTCFFGAVVCGMLRLPWLPSLILVACAGGVALLANALRATVLFFPESGMVHWPAWCHEGTGLVMHGLAMAALIILARRLEHHHPAQP